MIFAGIDPGIDGAMAIIDSNRNILEIFDFNPNESFEINVCGAMDCISKHNVASAALEYVNSFRMGRTSAFTLGGNFYTWRTILALTCTSWEFVYPKKWQKIIGLQALDERKKQNAILNAKLHFKDADKYLKLVKHHNRADALMIAEYCRLTKGF